MTTSIGIINENGQFETVMINDEMLVELNKKLRTEGITSLHTMDSKGDISEIRVKAIIQLAKGSKGHMMYIPLDE